MRLIGMLDSPYVRRVAISAQLLGLPVELEQISVFRQFEAFAAINPVVKAPTLVTDDGSVLMDSTLILEVLERLAPSGTSLQPTDPQAFIRSQRIVGLALAVCEKAVQIVYERQLRPVANQYEPWLARVKGQLASACGQLEAMLQGADPWLFSDRPLQADVSSAVACRFIREMVPDVLAGLDVPALLALSDRAEALPAFRACPFA